MVVRNLGWVDVPDINADGWVFHLSSDLRAWHNTPGSTIAVKLNTLRLPVDAITVVDNSVDPMRWVRYRALKSNYVPIEVSRRIPGFIPATEEAANA